MLECDFISQNVVIKKNAGWGSLIAADADAEPVCVLPLAELAQLLDRNVQCSKEDECSKVDEL